MPIYNPVIHQTSTLIVAASDSLYAERVDYTCDGTADDVEINAAFALGAADTRVVLLEGTYTLADPIIFTHNNQVLEGQGRGTFVDGDGLATTEHAIQIDAKTNCTVRNLAIQTADGGGGTIHCVYLNDGANYTTIDGVVIVDSDSDGVHIEGTDCQDIQIRNCVILDTDDAGIDIDLDAGDYCDRLTITNCAIQSTGAQGIVFGATGAGARYCVVSDNIVSDANHEGISLSEFLYGTVEGNIVVSSLYHGISLNDSNNSVANGNTCISNDSGAASLYHGIVLSVADKCTVSGNNCYGNGLHGIYLLRSDYNTVTGNTCTDNVAGDGIHIVGDGTGNSDYNQVTGNTCTANGDDGIEIAQTGATANGNVIMGNMVRGNSGTAIVDGGTLTVIRDNEGISFGDEYGTTFVVAASNSLQPANADYVCDNTADDVQINAALTAGGAGARIVLLEGTYTLADPIAFTNNSQVLEGQGRGTFIDGDGLATTEHAISATGLTNCEIKNLAVQTEDGGAKTCHCIFLDDGCNYTKIENVVIVDSDEDGIHIAGTSVTDIKIINCIIEDADDHGIFVDMDGGSTSSGILIEGCRITGTGDDGIYFGATGTVHTYARITNNLIDSAGDCGIDICEVSYSVLSGNILHTNTDDGISLSAGSNQNIIADNTSYNNTSVGIHIGGNYNLVASNACIGNGTNFTDTGTLNRIKNNRGVIAGDEGVATFVVAATDSYRPANADWNCDGTADDIQIQAALDTLPAAGGRVILMEGNYACAVNITIPANATLEGQGNATILTFDDPLVNNAFILNGNHIIVKSMKVVIAAGCGDVGGGGFRPNIIYANSKSHLGLSNLWLVGDKTLGSDGSDERQCGIIFITVTDSKIIDCHIEGTERYCIQLYSTSNHNAITGCVCEASAKTALLVRDTCEGNSVTGNVFQDNGEQGFYIHTSSHNTITGNTSQGNSGMGIYLYLADNNTITGNTIADNDSGGTLKEGIELYCSDQNVVTGNQINDNGLHGIAVYHSSYNTISGNICNNQNTGDGIHVLGDGTENSDYNLITGNVCTGNGDDGIAIEGAGDANKNIVLGNQLTGNSGTAFVDNGTATQIGHNITA